MAFYYFRIVGRGHNPALRWRMFFAPSKSYSIKETGKSMRKSHFSPKFSLDSVAILIGADTHHLFEHPSEVGAVGKADHIHNFADFQAGILQ